MKRYAFCSKIPEDTRIRRRAYAQSFRGQGVECALAGDFKFGLSDIKNTKKTGKKFKISLFCPLIIATWEDAMINNMVLSREIEWIGYEHKRSMLQVEFIVGSIYQYENVPETVYQEFLTAPSHGRFFESNIKNKYQVRKVR